MSDNGNAIPPRLREIIDDFRTADNQAKMELLLDYADQVPPLPDWIRERQEAMRQIEECMTPAFVYADTNAGTLQFYFDIPPESPTVRGYAGLLHAGVAGCTPEEILRIPGDFFQEMGMQCVLSPQRLNGISAILAHMKRLALAHINTSK
jgi:cysteine desulfuration protein SufE